MNREPFSPDKPFRTYDEQIDLLIARGLIIQDRGFAKHSLQTYSYYDLVNGNVEPLLISEHPDHFKDGITFEILIQIRIIEDFLKPVFLSQILKIEKTFKTTIAYYVSENFGVNSNIGGYLDSSHYSQASSRKKRVKRTLKEIRDINDGNVRGIQGSPIIYYRTNHNHIPPWISVMEFTLGQTINWYKILPLEGRISVARQLLPSNITLSDQKCVEYFTAIISLIRQFRNHFAHNDVLSQMQSREKVNMKIINEILKIPIVKSSEILNKNMNNLFACVFCILVLSNDTNQLKIFTSSINGAMEIVENSANTFNFKEIFGLPTDLISRIQRLIDIRSN
ncbi:Abi family protein [Secundilactobacillus hailunensis]|uniref:Abi family protein n=1 Tax=Secundilactobacillus hailunensis TaxID=2559923 RepID=A0ABW1T5J1_9LACO|nr:Abi family protein [Secundilactobacillus hailunensis]